MTHPSPNPGGQNERLIRTIAQQWLLGLDIAGVGAVYRAIPPQMLIEWGQGPLYGCAVLIELGHIRESRMAYTGPTDPGGKDANYDIILHIGHRCADNDRWEDAQDDLDRIKDAIKDGLRAFGRDLGRPDVILQAGDWPAENSIETDNDAPVWDSGMREQWSRISFVVTQYMQRQP